MELRESLPPRRFSEAGVKVWGNTDARAANQNGNMNDPRNDEERFPTICFAGNVLAHDGGGISHGTMALVGDRSIRLHFETGTNTMQSVWPIRGENRAFSINPYNQGCQVNTP
jgi:hypothetical protein